VVVKVAIDLALDRLFDYEVPEALEKKLAVGQLLSVPFGHREARGFAMAVGVGREARGERQEPRPLKPIHAIVDETPFFTPSLLELVRKLAAYTGAPLESVLKAAVPASVLKKNVRPRELMFVEPAFATEPVKLTTRQQWLYDQVVRLGGGWMTQLCEELKTTPATLKALGKLGLLKVAVRARRRDPLAGRKILPTKPLPLNDEQAMALEAIVGRETRGERHEPGDCGRRETLRASSLAPRDLDCPARASCLVSHDLPLRPILLHGVTGSGKTEVYLQAIARELAEGRGAIVLVPEISLTPQTVARFAGRFGDSVAVLHSALSDGERYDEWHRIRSGAARVVIGPRSAVFAPVRDLGLIVVDEEHEPSYKQEELPRYHARDAAVLRGAIERARVVLGSATPSLETWRNVQLGKYACASLTKRAGAGTLPNILVVDMKETAQEGSRGAIFSQQLLEAIHRRLDRHEQTILFLNRRGYSRSVVCDACGHVMTCPACDLPYTYHRADSCLRCHVCGGWEPLPAKCPACSATSLSYKGIGTQRAEAALKACCPRATVLRMDADSTSRKSSHDDILSAFRRGEADILLGTQMIAKGLDFPNVTLVGVLNADSSLMMPDFRAAERTYQLLAQVAGRAGRAELPGEVVIQSWDPDAFAIRAAAKGDFAAFAERELRDRAEGWFPPYCHLATVNFRSCDLRLVSSWAEMYAKSFRAYAARIAGGTERTGRHFLVGEAVPSALEKADGQYRWQIVLRAERPSDIVSAWRWLMGVRPPPKNLLLALDLDAYNLV